MLPFPDHYSPGPWPTLSVFSPIFTQPILFSLHSLIAIDTVLALPRNGSQHSVKYSRDYLPIRALYILSKGTRPINRDQTTTHTPLRMGRRHIRSWPPSISVLRQYLMKPNTPHLEKTFTLRHNVKPIYRESNMHQILTLSNQHSHSTVPVRMTQ